MAEAPGRPLTRRRAAVLISGRGSNLRALIEHCARPRASAAIALVVSNQPAAAGLAHAGAAGIPEEVVDHRCPGGRADFERHLTSTLQAYEIELVCLAGFMRVLSADFVAAWQDRLLNIHPSLLPAFPGLNTHARALAAGVRLSGCSVHFVTATVDGGPIVGQAAVPVLPEDDEASLAARVLAAEHELYPRCLALVAGGRVRWVGGSLAWDAPAAAGRLVNPA
jgi:formyltetrahydrofolate-dependent phosphoribosylglycinamide formyltransferase